MFPTWDNIPGFVYLGIFLAAAIEGEVVYTGAVVLAYMGRLNPAAVLFFGAMGGSAGDQFFFYVLRTRLASWLDRFPKILRRREIIRKRVLRNANLMVLISRFLPGLRIAVSAACAYAGVRPLRFTLLSIVSGMAWAGSIMLVVMYLGPSSMRELGIHAWWTPIIPAVFVILFFRWLSREK